MERIPTTYFLTIPSVPEFGAERILGPLRLREIRKILDNGQAINEIEHIAQECMEEIVELCSGKNKIISVYRHPLIHIFRLHWKYSRSKAI